MHVVVEEVYDKANDRRSALAYVVPNRDAADTLIETQKEARLSDNFARKVKFYIAEPVEVGSFKKDWVLTYEEQKELDDIPF